MNKIAITTLLVVQTALAVSAGAVQMFDFDAQAVIPATVGGTAEVHGLIVNGEAVAAPLPLDFANFEYTIVVTGLALDSAGATSVFTGGTVTIYQDDATIADWASPATFTDGTAILSGPLATFQHAMLTGTLGSGSGHVDWTGGSRLDEIAPADRLGWPLLTGISRAATQVLPGYTERWDGKVEPLEDIVDGQDATWSDLKVRFR
jgi:hypothetical protein